MCLASDWFTATVYVYIKKQSPGMNIGTRIFPLIITSDFSLKAASMIVDTPKTLILG